MTHIICADLAPIPVHSVLFDWCTDSAELQKFINAVTSNANIKDFGKSALNQGQSICACEAISILVQCRITQESTRIIFIEEEKPHEDFEETDFESWDGIMLAIQFAGDDLIMKIMSKIPTELISAAIAVMPPENQARARSICYQ